MGERKHCSIGGFDLCRNRTCAIYFVSLSEGNITKITILPTINTTVVGRTPGSCRRRQMCGGPPVRLDIYSISGHARFWYRIGTDGRTRMTINDDIEESVCAGHEPRIPLGSDHLSRGSTSLLTTSRPGIWVTTVVQ